jgi:hypothetical protein
MSEVGFLLVFHLRFKKWLHCLRIIPFSRFKRVPEVDSAAACVMLGAAEKMQGRQRPIE